MKKITRFGPPDEDEASEAARLTAGLVDLAAHPRPEVPRVGAQQHRQAADEAATQRDDQIDGFAGQDAFDTSVYVLGGGILVYRRKERCGEAGGVQCRLCFIGKAGVDQTGVGDQQCVGARQLAGQIAQLVQATGAEDYTDRRVEIETGVLHVWFQPASRCSARCW